MADVAAQAPAGQRSPWLSDLEHQLRVHAIVGPVSRSRWTSGATGTRTSSSPWSPRRAGGWPGGAGSPRGRPPRGRARRHPGPLARPGSRGHRAGGRVCRGAGRHHPGHVPAGSARPPVVFRPSRRGTDDPGSCVRPARVGTVWSRSRRSLLPSGDRREPAPAVPAVHRADRAPEGSGGRGRLEHARPGAGGAGLHRGLGLA